MALVSCSYLEKALQTKQDVLLGCDGVPLVANTRVATCDDLDAVKPNHDASVYVQSAFGDEIGFIHNSLNKGN